MWTRFYELVFPFHHSFVAYIKLNLKSQFHKQKRRTQTCKHAHTYEYAPYNFPNSLDTAYRIQISHHIQSKRYTFEYSLQHAYNGTNTEINQMQKGHKVVADTRPTEQCIVGNSEAPSLDISSIITVSV